MYRRSPLSTPETDGRQPGDRSSALGGPCLSTAQTDHTVREPAPPSLWTINGARLWNVQFLGRSLFKMLPDAFLFDYAGGDGNLVRLSFRSNPNFHPPSMEARVFHDMEGEMWVDCKQERLAAFSGHLTRDVKFGLGLLGHLDKGGHFEVRQAEVVPGHWDLTNMNVEITGKALLFATIGMRKKETHGDFYQVSDDLTLAEAADMLNRKIVVADSH